MGSGKTFIYLFRRRQCFKPFTVGFGELLPVPDISTPRIGVEIVEINLAEARHIMIATQRKGSAMGNHRHTLVGRRPIPDRIAETPELIKATRLVKHCFKCGVVGMNIREDKNTHRIWL